MTEGERSAIVVVDDDRSVLAAVEADLRKKYSRDYRVVGAGSGESALDVLGRLKSRGERAALVVADQRMPRMTGTQMLARVSEIFPAAKRVLLTAYADTDAAIDAINMADVDYYILKPWDPPEERLYPVLDELLETWQATTRRPEAGLRVVGARWSPDTHRVRGFLSRNQIPFRWLDAERTLEARELIAALDEPPLPVVILDDGTTLESPTSDALARAVGMRHTPEAEFFDLVVVGGGPAGLAAAVYGASEGLTAAVIEADAPGGQAGTSSRIENYLGFPQGVSGAELARRALTQAKRLGAHVVTPRSVVGMSRSDPYRLIELDDGTRVSCTAVIVATGVSYKQHPAPGVERLVGRGVFYGSTAHETDSVHGEQVVVVGGANSAGQAAVHLSRHAERVTMLVRSDSLEAGMSSYLIEQVRDCGVEVRLGTTVTEAVGEERLEAVRASGPEGEEHLDASAMFVFIGAEPHTEWLEGAVVRDEHGFIRTGPSLESEGLWSLERDPYLFETSVPGVFAVGDVRADSVKRVAAAVGEGSVAIHFVHAYLGG